MAAWDERRLNALIGLQVLDGLYSAIPNPVAQADLDRLGVDPAVRPLIPIAKFASVVGLSLGRGRPRLGALTCAGLVLYYALALGAHARVRDESWRYGAAAGMLGWSLVTWRYFRSLRRAAV